MASAQPQTPSQLLDISGVGEAKLARYGETFLNEIRNSA
jgi:ATP-dependent DNA helicase RecQ